ncbi:FmdB family zinc ribbon protein [Propionivibrio soli]|uniref:FmdB family zinc ribbon protein n=1 Tax=Propionivibrio soli TaxID=2976531 RepID=UPI0021E8E8CB|nr:FmdB family zinc ribbon protein [Propionivibrio soli]
MPIYAYRCSSCGFEKDHLQKLNAPVLTDCPECGAKAYQKQITAAGFQLKGNGWYATDFKGGSGTPKASKSENAPQCQGCAGAEACAAS